MHDNTLRRTTDVEKLFPERAGQDSSMFNWTDLQALNAGQWFLKDDPFWTASSLSEADWALAGNQSVCTLSEVLQLAKNSSKSILFNVRRPPPEHPHRESWINVTLHTVLQSGIQQQHVMWTPDTDRQLVRQTAPGFQQTSAVKKSVKILQEEGIVRLNLRYNQVSTQEIRDSREGNVSLTLFTVSEPWLYSVLWCSGVQSVTSDAPHILRKLPYPIWLMPPEEYKLLWITADVISFIVIIGVFVLQKWRLGSIRSYNPEQIMLSAAVRRSSRDVNIMKEKLIFSGTPSLSEQPWYLQGRKQVYREFSQQIECDTEPTDKCDRQNPFHKKAKIIYIYSALRKYSAPLNFATFCHISGFKHKDMKL
ncbi:UNVERIFIED_CONTAM: hypothetical protein FKN15_017780 [Acipenser sinensis]